MKLNLRSIKKRLLLVRAASILTTFTLVTASLPGIGSAASAMNARGPSEPAVSTSGSSSTAQLAADVGACSRVSASAVAAYATDVRDAHVYGELQRRIPGPDLTSPASIRAFTLATMPKFHPMPGTWHQMSAAEYATFRAGNLVVYHGKTVSEAIATCRVQAAAAAARVKPLIVCPVGGQCGVNYALYEQNYDTSGSRGYVNANTKTGAISGVYGYGSGSGSTQTETVTASGPVTVSSWEPYANGGKGGIVTFPASQAVITDAQTGKKITIDVPAPASVVQSGWVVLPGTPYWCWFGNNAGVLQLNGTGNDYVISALSSTYGLQNTYHFVNPNTGQTAAWSGPVTYAYATGASIAAKQGLFSGGKLSPEVGFSTQGLALMSIGAALMSFGGAATLGGLLAGNPPIAALGVLSAVLGGIVTWEATKYTDTVQACALEWDDDDDFWGDDDELDDFSEDYW